MFFIFESWRGWKASVVVRLILFALLAWVSLGWTRNMRLDLDAFPLELSTGLALELQLGAVILGAAAFAAAIGRRGLVSGAAYGLIVSAIGWCSSRWPQLARAIELCGGAFLAVMTTTFLTSALAVTCAALAAALVREDWRPISRRLVLGLVAAWGISTCSAEVALSQIWGFGPRALPEAAGVPTNRGSSTLAVAWLYPTRGRSYHVDLRRMSSETTDLSLDSIDRLEAFLEKSRLRGVFAAEALSSVRLGRLQWWDEERALDALMVAVPGRAYPDYRRALELLRAGPLTAERFGKLEQLAAATGRRVEGFERASDSQYIFEGFSAAYARFGDEPKAREWLSRLDGLWAVSEKRIEVGSLEDLRTGQVAGSAFLNDHPATSLRVGLFLVWTSSATRTTHYWLSSSRVPDEDGRFYFDNLGPGRYILGLLGRSEDLRGSFAGVPGVFEVTYERSEVLLDPVRLRHELEPSWEGPVPGAPPLGREPILPELPLRLSR